MKQKLHLAAVLCVLFVLFAAPSVKAEVKSPKISCHSYVVMDAGSGEILLSQDADKKIYPASTTKLMTAIVCLENGDVNAKIKTKADVVYHTTPGTYSVGIGAGVNYTFLDLMNMSLVASSADATDSLAVGVFGSKEKCVEAMNAKVKELGLTHTSFDNPVGSDLGAGYENNYSTAREMSLITRYAMTKTEIRKAVRRRSYTASVSGVTVNTTNRFIRGTYYYDSDQYEIIGTKSGTTDAGGHVFIATAKDKKGHEVICAFFGDDSVEATFAGIRKLYNYTFKEYKKGNITLSQSGYDVRGTDTYGEQYSEYASTNSIPADENGKVNPATKITRSQLAKMIASCNDLEDDKVLARFVKGNNSGSSAVTVSDAANLIQDLYPAHISEEEVEEILADCSHTDSLTAEEKEAYAILVKNHMMQCDQEKNAFQILTRGQALLLVDGINDYKVRYLAAYPDYQLISAAQTTEDEEKELKTSAEEAQNQAEPATTEAPDVYVEKDKDGYSIVIHEGSYEAQQKKKKEKKQAEEREKAIEEAKQVIEEAEAEAATQASTETTEAEEATQTTTETTETVAATETSAAEQTAAASVSAESQSTAAASGETQAADTQAAEQGTAVQTQEAAADIVTLPVLRVTCFSQKVMNNLAQQYEYREAARAEAEQKAKEEEEQAILEEAQKIREEQAAATATEAPAETTAETTEAATETSTSTSGTTATESTVSTEGQTTSKNGKE